MPPSLSFAKLPGSERRLQWMMSVGTTNIATGTRKWRRISDLIAFLAALDPEPFLAALGLPIRQAQVRREVRLGDPAGNADLVVSDEAGPVALLEVKASAAQHEIGRASCTD